MELWGLSIVKVTPNETPENTKTKLVLKSLLGFTCSEQVVKHPQLCWFNQEHPGIQSRREQSCLIIILKPEVQQCAFSKRGQLTCPHSKHLVLLHSHERHRAEAGAEAGRVLGLCASLQNNSRAAEGQRAPKTPKFSSTQRQHQQQRAEQQTTGTAGHSLPGEKNAFQSGCSTEHWAVASLQMRWRYEPEIEVLSEFSESSISLHNSKIFQIFIIFKYPLRGQATKSCAKSFQVWILRSLKRHLNYISVYALTYPSSFSKCPNSVQTSHGDIENKRVILSIYFFTFSQHISYKTREIK